MIFEKHNNKRRYRTWKWNIEIIEEEFCFRIHQEEWRLQTCEKNGS